MKKVLPLLLLVCLVFAASKGVQRNAGTSLPVTAPKVVVPEPDNEDRSDVIPIISSITKSYFSPERYGDATKIEFSNGTSFDTRYLGKGGEPDLPGDLKISYQDEEYGYYIVQFAGPIYETQKDWLKTNGAKIHFYLPRYGFVVSLKNREGVDAIRANPAVNWVGIYQPAYKISRLFDEVSDEHVVTILLFLDSDISTVLNDVKAITKRSEFAISDNGINKKIQGVVNKSKLNELARIKGIYWIEPYIQPRTCNNLYQWVVQDWQQDVRNIWAKGIAGQGEIINHCDSGIYTSHYAMRAGSAAITTWGVYPTHNKIVAYDSGAATSIVWGDAAGASWHGTHTAGTIAGNDTTLGTDARDGIAKMARIYHNDCGSTTNAIYTYGLNELYDRSYNKYYASNGIRAYISSNSWGAATGGAYTGMCQEADQFMWNHKDYLICYSNGNSGPSANTVGSPAAAKNVLSVGACGNGTAANTILSFSSRGPTDDGRYKPTIMTPGSCVSAQGGTANSYWSMQGTSMSCPGAAGATGLARQYLREGWYPYGKKVAGAAWSYISAAMMKAILVNCADPNIGAYVVPDNNIGWGRIDLDSTLYFAGEARKTLLVDDTIGVLTGERADYHFSVPAGAANLKIAVVWTDYYGNPVILRQIVNDLDLTAYIGATYYRGNQYSGGQSVANPAGRDSLNVEECIRVNAPTAGDWLVRVEGRNVPIGPQPFALVITYNAAAIAGVVDINKPVYRVNDFIVDTVRVRVEDINYGVVGIRDTVRVSVVSKYGETQPETLRCVELAETAYVFRGDIPLLFRKATHGDGRISAWQGDTITVTYVDNNPSYTSTTWAAADAYYFVITNVHCENISAFTVDVCWSTNEGSNTKVYYGTNPSNLNLVATADYPYVFNHRITLTGLSEKTRYYYDVESKDFRGNLVKDDNGGRHYSFSTENFAAIDVLVALADGSDKGTASGSALPDLQRRFEKAIQVGGWSYVWWATSDHAGYLPPVSQIRQFKAVFMPNEDEYPPFLRSQQDTIRLYQEGGGRIAFAAHDFLWWAWDPAGGNPNMAFDSAWCKNYLHARYKGDIVATGTFRIYGIAGDPVSGNYTGGVTYSPHRSGADGDTVITVPTPPNGWDAGGTSAYCWRWNSATGNYVGARWESGQNHGTPGQGVWGGQRTRVVMDAFTATQMDTLVLPNVLNDHFIYLIGHDHPDVNITSPVTGNTYNTSPIQITWTATAYGGAAIDTTWIEYSPDGGQTWLLIIKQANLTSPYNWDVTTINNHFKYQVRITVNDRNVYPSLKGSGKTGNFTINRTGGDLLGPIVLPQSIVVPNNPKIVTATDTMMNFTAVVNDSETGLSTIGAAQWYCKNSGVNSMTVVDGSWDEIREDVAGTIRFNYIPAAINICTLYVRGRDNATLKALNWGPWYYRTFTVIDGDIKPVGVSEFGTATPSAYALYSPLPNPSLRQVKISFAVPQTTKVSLKVYNCLGQLVRTLVNEERRPGYYTVVWDGKDDTGRNLSSGIYFYQFSTNEFQDTKKAVLLK